MKIIFYSLVFYSITCTVILWNVIENNFTPISYLKEYGDSASKWSFGKSWREEKVCDAIKDWNILHHDTPIDGNETVRKAMAEVGWRLILQKDKFQDQDNVGGTY